jgi:hypothetical protein
MAASGAKRPFTYWAVMECTLFAELGFDMKVGADGGSCAGQLLLKAFDSWC